METITQALEECGVPTDETQTWDRRQGTATVEPPPEPEAPPEKPSLLSRIGNIFQREKQTHRRAYLTLVERSSTRELSGKEVEALAVAMRGAGFTESDLAKHQRLLEAIPEAREAVQKQKAADEQVKATHIALSQMDEPVREILKKQETLHRLYDEACANATVNRGAADRLHDLEKQAAALFGESV
jgi:hypothetical protein